MFSNAITSVYQRLPTVFRCKLRDTQNVNAETIYSGKEVHALQMQRLVLDA